MGSVGSNDSIEKAFSRDSISISANYKARIFYCRTWPKSQATIDGGCNHFKMEVRALLLCVNGVITIKLVNLHLEKLRLLDYRESLFIDKTQLLA